METKNKSQRGLGLIAFTLGLLVGLFLISTSVWADLEATFYGFGRFYVESLSSLSCPVFLDQEETGTMSVRLRNVTERDQQRTVLIRLSSRLVPIENRLKAEVPAGMDKRLVWSVDASNMDLGHFIFAHAVTYPASQAPMQEAMCGVFVLNTPFGLRGQHFYFLLVAVCVLCLGVGLWLWDSSRIPAVSRLPQVRMGMSFLVMVILVGVVASYLGVWMLGIVALMLILVMMTSILYLVTTN